MNIDAMKIGAYISSLRKERDLTQLELAEKLFVSHQAVSRWETGQSIPDINVIVELSKLFNISVDQLLSADSKIKKVSYDKIMKDVKDENIEELTKDIKNGEVNIEDVVNVAPLLKYSQLENIVHKLNGSFSNFNFENIKKLAPFISAKSLEILIENSIDNEEISLEGVLPFLNEKSISKIVDVMLHNGKEVSIQKIAPFADEETITKLCEAAIRRVEVIDPISIAPFVSTQTLDKLCLFAIEKGHVISPNSISHFVSAEMLDKLCDIALKNGEVIDPIELAPFVDSSKLGAIVIRAINNGQDVDIAGLTPFLDSSFFDAIIIKEINKVKNP